MKNYTILTELGKGAFGVVHKARNDNGKFFAVKSLLNSTDEQVSQKELEMAEHISKHDNIVLIHEYFTNKTRDGQEIFIIMEFCEGGDLDGYIVRNKPEVMERFNFMVDMARGVNYLHSIKVCHRDLKPQNVLLTHNGDRFVCKITDFGISKLQTSADMMFSTQCGSIPFVAPEIVDGAQYTFSVDIFSLGLLFFAVATAAVIRVGTKLTLLPATLGPSGHPDLLNTQIRAKRITLDNFLQHFQRTSKELGKVIFGMLNVDPDKRPGIDLVIAQVAEVKGGLQAGAAAPPSARPTSGTPRRKSEGKTVI